MQEKIFRNIIANVIIIVSILSVFAVTFFGNNQNMPAVSQTDYEVIYHGNTKKNNLSLMFNVYDNAKNIQKILQVLEKNNVKATFFISGSFAEKNKNIILQISDAGHEIGNHGYFQNDFKKLNYDQSCEQIITTERLLYQYCGIKTVLFAPPFGSIGKDVLKACQNLGYKVIMNSRVASSGAKNGDFILLNTAEAADKLENIIKQYKSSNLNIVKVSENIG